MDLGKALAWAASRKHGVLITIRKDGRPQSSDIVYVVEGDSFLISLTNDRAKTRNIRRDPRVVLHLSHPDSWSYLSFDGIVELSAVTTSPDDTTANRLVEYYRALAGEHGDWADYRSAMINDKRLIATFTPRSVVGQVN